MVIYTIINVSVFGICLAEMLKKNTDEAMSINNTNGMRGFFIMLMIAHHISQHIPEKSIWTLIFGSVGALLTSVFFFLSGYGNYNSYCRRNGTSGRKWIRQKGLMLIVPFEIIYPFIFILYSKTPDSYINGALTLTFPGITNWFIKVMLGCYIAFFIIYFVFPFKTAVKNLILFVSVVFVIVTFISLKMDSIWWSSVLLFPLGVCYAHCKEKIDSLLDKWYIFVIVFILFAVLHILAVKVSRYFEIVSCVFAVISFLCVNKKLTLSSKIFQFTGKFSYEIYLIHCGLLASVYNVERLSELNVLVIYLVTLVGGYILHQLVYRLLDRLIKR